MSSLDLSFNDPADAAFDAEYRRRTFEVDVSDPMEVARWAWLLDAPDAQVLHAVRMVGPNGEAVGAYLAAFGRAFNRLPI